jgi:pimeloyl-ACP methyl ester carboxylesterase
MLNWYRAILRRPMPVPAPGTLSTPCLILWGDSDLFGIPKLADESATLCAEAEAIHLPGIGHWITHDARETVLTHLQRFIA